MRILHVCLASFYIDDYSYQENILPIEHQRLGNDVLIIASTETFVDNNSLGYLKPSRYFTKDNIPIIRLGYVKYLPHAISKKLRLYVGFEYELERYRPDIIFVHDLQFLDILKVRKYCEKNANVIVYVDCHADFSNSARTFFSKNILHKIIYKYCARKIQPVTKVFWGVLPSRVSFLRDMYKIPENRIKLLEMGAQEELIKNALLHVNETRKAFGYQKDDFIIVSGGKIDKEKADIVNLMKSVNSLDRSNVKLIIFGSVSKELECSFRKELFNPNITYVGWKNYVEIYKIISIANLAVFPGRHSVLWEQTVAQGIPILVKYWDNLEHLQLGGNLLYLKDCSKIEILNTIENLLANKVKYYSMLNAAQGKSKEKFYYSSIAKRSIEIG